MKNLECPYKYGENCFARRVAEGNVTNECDALDEVCVERSGVKKEICPFYKPKKIWEKHNKGKKEA